MDDFDSEELVHEFLQRLGDGPLLAVLAVQTLKPSEFRLHSGWRLLKWEWHRGTLRLFSIKDCFFFQPAPMQVLNEIRNALAHLSRLLKCDSGDAAQKELDRADTHLQRAERDGYKILAIYHHDALLKLGRTIHSKNHSFPNSFYKGYNDLVIRRKEISIKEHESPTVSTSFSQVASEYKELSEAAIAFTKEIESNHKITWWDKIWYAQPIWRRRLGWFLIPFFVALITCLLVETYTCGSIIILDRATSNLGIGSVLSERCKGFTVSETH